MHLTLFFILPSKAFPNAEAIPYTVSYLIDLMAMLLTASFLIGGKGGEEEIDNNRFGDSLRILYCAVQRSL